MLRFVSNTDENKTLVDWGVHHTEGTTDRVWFAVFFLFLKIKSLKKKKKKKKKFAVSKIASAEECYRGEFEVRTAISIQVDSIPEDILNFDRINLNYWNEEKMYADRTHDIVKKKLNY